MSPSLQTLAAKQADGVDSRYHLAPGLRRQINKVFPTHWSFLLGEIALYSFVILLISGVFLTLFFDPSLSEVEYNGIYEPLRGVTMSRAYATTLDISFEVRGGLFMRQIHHWAALMFAASIIVHMMRIFFTGAFRRPREANWVIGGITVACSQPSSSSSAGLGVGATVGIAVGGTLLLCGGGVILLLMWKKRKSVAPSGDFAGAIPGSGSWGRAATLSGPVARMSTASDRQPVVP